MNKQDDHTIDPMRFWMPIVIDFDDYEAAGAPFGKDIRGLILWLRYRGQARGN